MSSENKNCCTPKRGSSPSSSKKLAIAHSTNHVSQENGDDNEMVHLEGGSFLMGTDSGIGFSEDGEGPVREVYINPFLIDKTTVTNAAFSRFVRETNYTTEAEQFGWSFVFYQFLPEKL